MNREPLLATYIADDLFRVDLYGEFVAANGVLVTRNGRCAAIVNRERVENMLAALQAALNGFAPSPGRPHYTMPSVDDMNPEDFG